MMLTCVKCYKRLSAATKRYETVPIFAPQFHTAPLFENFHQSARGLVQGAIKHTGTMCTAVHDNRTPTRAAALTSRAPDCATSQAHAEVPEATETGVSQTLASLAATDSCCIGQ